MHAIVHLYVYMYVYTMYVYMYNYYFCRFQVVMQVERPRSVVRRCTSYASNYCARPSSCTIVNTEYKRSVIITFVRTHVHVSLRTMGYSNNIPIVTRYMYKLIWNYSSHRFIPASLWKPGYITPGHHLPHPMRQLLCFFSER